MFESKEKSLNCQFDGCLSMLEHSDFSQFIKTSSINDDVYKSTWQLTILVDLPIKALASPFSSYTQQCM